MKESWKNFSARSSGREEAHIERAESPKEISLGQSESTSAALRQRIKRNVLNA